MPTKPTISAILTSCLSDSDPLEIIRRWSGCQRTLEHGNELFLVDPRPLDRSSPREALDSTSRETSRYTVTVHRLAIGRLTLAPSNFELRVVNPLVVIVSSALNLCIFYFRRYTEKYIGSILEINF